MSLRTYVLTDRLKHEISIIIPRSLTYRTQTIQIAIMVKTLRFADVEVPVPGFGAMGISFALGKNLTYEQAEPVLLRALELGCTFWDTAVRVGDQPTPPDSTDQCSRSPTATV